MSNYKRLLNIYLPDKQSAFLWGARKTGKSTYLRQAFPDAIYYDLLKSDLFLRLLKEPQILREELLDLEKKNTIVIIDEVQKVPALLDEIHWLIENTNFKFILCGSSARKLKQKGVNMLGGRAWKYHLFPLVFPELIDFDLLKVLTHGTIPSHYRSTQVSKSLRAYLEDYIVLEIQTEGLVRNLPAFSRFMESLKFSHGEMLNYSHIGRDCSIDAKTVKEYFQILVDTLMGYFVFPYRKKVKRDIISEAPKFYLFDVGVANAVKKETVKELKGAEAGRSFEHFIFLEILAYRGLFDFDFDITYWRTKTGHEVDFVLGKGKVIVEVKIKQKIDRTDLTGLTVFLEEHQPEAAFLVCLEPRSRKVTTEFGDIRILPYEKFLTMLWNKEVI